MAIKSEDLLMLILSRLPVKSLLRFKSVSKYWHSLVRNPSFITLHHHHAAENTDCLFVKRSLNGGSVLSVVPDDNLVEDIDMSSTGLDIKHLQFLGHCNGIVCLTFGFTFPILLCNPSIREFRVLPRPSYEVTSNLGLGFNPFTNDYKMVRFAVMSRDLSCTNVTDVDEKVEIYDLSTDSWRKVDVGSPIEAGVDCSSHLFTSWNGDCFWYANRYLGGGGAIVAFSMTDEVFKEMPAPQVCLLDRHSDKKLFVWKDSLALAIYHKRFLQDRAFLWELSFDVWVMNEEDVEVSWTRKFTIGHFKGIDLALGFRKNGEFLVGSIRGQMMSYNINTQERKEYQVHDHIHGCSGPSFLQALLYTETFVSVKRHNEQDEHVE